MNETKESIELNEAILRILCHSNWSRMATNLYECILTVSVRIIDTQMVPVLLDYALYCAGLGLLMNSEFH